VDATNTESQQSADEHLDPEETESSFPRGISPPTNSPLYWVENKDRYLRQLLIRDIERETGRPLCVYFASGEMTSQITQEDVGRLYEVIGPYRGMPFDLLIETSGGVTDAAEGLVSLIRFTSSDVGIIRLT